MARAIEAIVLDAVRAVEDRPALVRELEDAYWRLRAIRSRVSRARAAWADHGHVAVGALLAQIMRLMGEEDSWTTQ